MKAIGINQSSSIDSLESIQEFELSKPEPKRHDLLVKVIGVSVNPVDVGVRKSVRTSLKTPKIIGWDAVGVVQNIGDKVTLFKPGDKVFYAGSFKRPGCNSEFHLVDERIVGHAPKNITDAEIAAMPLTSLTAWESLFEKLPININNTKENSEKVILIINGSGGVGSIATQLAKIAGLNVISTASKPETIKWTKAHGADMVVNHHKNLVDEVHLLGYQYVDYILELNNIDQHWNEMSQLIKPDGNIVSITENKKPINLKTLTRKRVNFAWEWMFSKSYYSIDNSISQKEILDKVAEYLDSGKIKSTVTKELSPINAENIRKAHQAVESGHMMGKVVITNK